MKKLLFVILCIFLLSTKISYAQPLSVTLTGTPSACGFNNGSVSVLSVTGGVPPYTYLWSTGSTMSSIVGLTPGVYTLQVYDSFGQQATGVFTVLNMNNLNANNLSYTLPTFPTFYISYPCGANNDGKMYLNLINIGGTGPYSTSVLPPYNSSITSSFLATDNAFMYENVRSTDTFSVVITDANGCSSVVTNNLVYPADNFNHTLSVSPTCGGNSNGVINIGFSNTTYLNLNVALTGPIDTSILGTSANFSFQDLLPGVYNVNASFIGTTNVCDTNFTVVVPNLGNMCGTVEGYAKIDSSNYCVNDTSDISLAGRKIQFQPSQLFCSTDSNGYFKAQLPYATYTASLLPIAGTQTINCSSTSFTLTAINDSISGLFLSDTVKNYRDISIVLSGNIPRPGFYYYIYAYIKNNSLFACDSVKVLVTKQNNISFNNCNYPSSIPSANQIEVSLGTLAGLQDKLVVLQFYIPPNPLLIGTSIVTTADVTSQCLESNLVNNSAIVNTIISGSYDPNLKVAGPDYTHNFNLLIDVDSIINYTILFQNTGNDTAFNIVLIDTLSQYLNIGSLEFGGSSHPCTWNINTQNILRIEYNNIYLPDSGTNNAASNGFFTYQVKTKSINEIQPLPVVLSNSAAIYFDFNPPIITNTVNTLLDLSVGIKEEVNKSNMSIFPNPTNGKITIRSLEKGELIISDINGKQVAKYSIQMGDNNINLSMYPNAMYIGTIFKSNQQSAPLKFKLIKQ